jgi:hypothetical protein
VVGTFTAIDWELNLVIGVGLEAGDFLLQVHEQIVALVVALNVNTLAFKSVWKVSIFCGKSCDPSFVIRLE